jgi:hypothetical protein
MLEHNADNPLPFGEPGPGIVGEVKLNLEAL